MDTITLKVVVKAICHVLDGNLYAGDNLKEKGFNRMVYGQGGGEGRAALDTLTNCERGVFRLVGNGLSIKESSERMGLFLKKVGT